MPIIESGRIKGETPLSELLKRGDFGLGHLNNMDGVLVILDGRPYNISEDGNVRIPKLFTGVPLASVCNFMIDTSITLPTNCSVATLREIIDTTIPDKNLFCAIKVHGRFHRVEANAPAASTVSDVQKNGWHPRVQRFPLKKVSGTLIGFRYPKLTDGVQAAGYRLAFLSDNLMAGGLVDDFVLADGTAEVDVCTTFSLELPPPEGAMVVLPK